MADQQIRFEDGAAYKQLMGIWSRKAGDVFLDWLALSRARAHAIRAAVQNDRSCDDCA